MQGYKRFQDKISQLKRTHLAFKIRIDSMYHYTLFGSPQNMIDIPYSQWLMIVKKFNKGKCFRGPGCYIFENSRLYGKCKYDHQFARLSEDVTEQEYQYFQKQQKFYKQYHDLMKKSDKNQKEKARQQQMGKIIKHHKIQYTIIIDSTLCSYLGLKECPCGNYKQQTDPQIIRRSQIMKSSKCYGCGDFGHYSNKCPKRKQKLKVICYRCKKEGHYATQCQEQ